MMTAAGGDSLNVEQVFSNLVYEGDSTNNRQFVNGIDLQNEGGMVITAPRSNGNVWSTANTERGATKYIYANGVNPEQKGQDRYGSFNADGYSLGSSSANSYVNFNGYTYCSWTFRKAPKFFDVVTFTGTGSTQSISHNLGSVPGMIVVKAATYTGGTNWSVYHRGVASDPETDFQRLNLASAPSDDSTYWADTAPTDTHFTVGTSIFTNGDGYEYVAWLFAHNDGDGYFGPTGDQDIIKCGNYTGNGQAYNNVIDIGFEPQWLMIKRYDSSGSWWVWDDRRAFQGEGGEGVALRFNSTGSESRLSNITVTPHPTGFSLDTNSSEVNGSNDKYIYVAIRRGPMATPEAASDVFARSTQNETTGERYGYYAGFPVDMSWRNITTGERAYISSRLRMCQEYRTDSNSNLGSQNYARYDDEVSWWNLTSTDANRHSWMFRRAPGFFDLLSYRGNGTAGRTIPHNLGITPEMMWVKITSLSGNWDVYHKDLGNTKTVLLNTNGSPYTASNVWYNTTPTDTHFTVGSDGEVNSNEQFYLAYLFGTVTGVSKVGSYTGNGTSQTIDCGFSSGSSFVLIRRTDSSGDWRYYDSKLGIVAGNDTSAKLNATPGGYINYYDDIDPANSGFIINQNGGSNMNVSNASYIFFAIAAI